MRKGFFLAAAFLAAVVLSPAPSLAQRAQVSSGFSAPRVVNIKDYGAHGDRVGYTTGTAAASGSTVTISGRNCSAADAGKYLMLHGSGTSYAPQVGQLSASTPCTGNAFNLPFTPVNATPWSGSWSATVYAAGTGALPADTLTCAGGTGVVTACQFTVATTSVLSGTVNSTVSGGTGSATCTLTGADGTGTKWTGTVPMSGGSVSSGATATITSGGSYTAFSSGNISAETVTVSGCSGLTAPTLTITMGVSSVTSAVPGQATSLASPNSVTGSGSESGVQLTLVAYQGGGQVELGSDDTAAFTSAAAAAQAANGRLYLPAGAYWLASQSSAISLSGIETIGDGWPTNAAPFSGGTTLLISNSTTAAFSALSDATISDLAIYYPAQDNSQSSPTSYPPTFEGALFVNDTFHRVRVLNSYDLFKVDAGTGSGWGRVFLDGMLAYCVDKCFWFTNGAADVPELGATNYWGQGAFGANANAGPAYLSRYTEASGAMFVVDVGSASYQSVDGIIMTGGILQGYRYGIRILSGTVDVSNISNMNWDQVGSVLSVEGTSKIISTSFSGGEYYSTNVYTPAQAANVFNFSSSSSASELTITGGEFTYAQGNLLADSAAGITALNFSSNRVQNFGQSTTGGQYGALKLTSSTSTLNVASNQVNCSGSNTTFFLWLQGYEIGKASGNTIANCKTPFYDGRSSGAGVFVLEDNSTFSTGSTGALQYTAAANALVDVHNHWDKQYAPTLTSGWGTSPTLASYSNDNFARITVGSSPSGNGVFTFYFQKWQVPACEALDETSSTILTAVATVTAVTVTGSKSASDVIALSCRQVN